MGGIVYFIGYFMYLMNKEIVVDQEVLIVEIVFQVNKFGYIEICKVDVNYMVLGCYVKGIIYFVDFWKRIIFYIDVLVL